MGCINTGAEVNLRFKLSKAFCASSFQAILVFDFKRSVNGAEMEEKFEINLRYQPHMPRKRRMCFTVFGSGNSTIARTLSGSTLMQPSPITYPKYFNCFKTNLLLSTLMVRLALRNHRATSFSKTRLQQPTPPKLSQKPRPKLQVVIAG